MTTALSAIIDSIAARVRDEANTAHTRADVMDLISRAQMLVNARFEYTLSYTTLTTSIDSSIYDIEHDLDHTLQVNEVRLGSKSLIKVPRWRNLWKLSRTWMTDIAHQPRGWAQIGKTLLVIWPRPQQPVDLLVTGVQVTPVYSDEAEVMAMRPENEDLVKDLVTAMLLVRSRDLDTASSLILRFVARARLQIPEIMHQQRIPAVEG